MSTLADALKGGGKFVKWADLGTGVVVSGTVTSTEVRQARQFDSTELAFWDDGTPQMQVVIELQTDARDDADDDGKRSLSINLWSGQKRALADACRAAGVPEPTPGDTFSAVWSGGQGNAKSPREFAYKIVRGTGLAAALTEAPKPDPWASTPAAMPADHAMAPPAAQANPIEAAKALLMAGVSQPEVAAATGYSPEIVAALAGQL